MSCAILVRSFQGNIENGGEGVGKDGVCTRPLYNMCYLSSVFTVISHLCQRVMSGSVWICFFHNGIAEHYGDCSITPHNVFFSVKYMPDRNKAHLNCRTPYCLCRNAWLPQLPTHLMSNTYKVTLSMNTLISGVCVTNGHNIWTCHFVRSSYTYRAQRMI